LAWTGKENLAAYALNFCVAKEYNNAASGEKI